MRQWSDQWVGVDRIPPFRIVRRSNGANVHIAYVDEQGAPVPEDDLMAHFADWAPVPLIGVD